MPRYMFITRYAKAGVKERDARRVRAEKSAAFLEGHIETSEGAFGADDCYTICELPDNAAAAHFASTVNVGLNPVRTIALPRPPRRIGGYPTTSVAGPPSRPSATA
jgi:uncharacterized protein with GYD domain